MTLAERLAHALSSGTAKGPTRDDYDSGALLTPAAVLVAITERPEPGVLLTVRNADLRRHAGQIAFPGGRTDPEDADATATALREAQEEIGLPPDQVRVIGTSDLYRTGTGFEITPVVGIIPPDLRLVPHEVEVSAIFEAPLAYLLDQANHARRSGEFRGRVRHYYEIQWGEHRIWGATAGMIVNLAGRLEAVA
jgi:8-oxo-dGTP pyrophosphatase MutT (NUDIX family)